MPRRARLVPGVEAMKTDPAEAAAVAAQARRARAPSCISKAIMVVLLDGRMGIA